MNMANKLKDELLDYFYEASMMTSDESKAVGLIVRRLINDSVIEEQRKQYDLYYKNIFKD